MPSIREIEIERDAEDLVELTREIDPTAVVTVASYTHRLRTVPERAEGRIWVAELGSRGVGRAQCNRNFFTEGSDTVVLNVAVRRAQRRLGIGGALYETGLRHARALGGGTLLSSFHENPAGVAFASRLGFSLSRAEQLATLDPRSVRDEASGGVDLRPVSSVDPRLVYAVDLEATLDMPQAEAVDDLPYDEWVGHVLEYPGFSAEGSFVALADGVAAAVSLLGADPESGRGHSLFTGTLRAYRGRGLARAVKLASIRWAAANGITTMTAANDETNAPMLAINRRLGYVPAGRRVEYVRAT